MNRRIFTLIVSLVILVPLQVLVFRHFVFFNLGFCFIYLLFLLSLPREVSIGLGMVIALIIGIVVDLFYQTIGIHAAAGVLIMFLKPYWLNMNVPRSGFEINHLPLIPNYGLGWFIGYSLPLILIYSLAVLFIEAGNTGLFWIILSKALITTVVTLFFVVILQYLFYSKSR